MDALPYTNDVSAQSTNRKSKCNAEFSSIYPIQKLKYVSSASKLQNNPEPDLQLQPQSSYFP